MPERVTTIASAAKKSLPVFKCGKRSLSALTIISIPLVVAPARKITPMDTAVRLPPTRAARRISSVAAPYADSTFVKKEINAVA